MTEALFSEERGYRRVEIGGWSFCVGEDLIEYASAASLLVGSFNNMPFHKLLGLELVAIERDKIVATIRKMEQLSGHVSLLHGGVIAACLDGVGAFQAMNEIWQRNQDASLLELVGRGRRLRTSKMRLEYLHAPRGDWFHISALTASYDGRDIVNRMEMIDPAGKQVAIGTGEYVELSTNHSERQPPAHFQPELSQS